MMFGLLILLLSGPGEPPVFGVVKEFETVNDCWTFLIKSDIPHKDKLMCLEVRKPQET